MRDFPNEPRGPFGPAVAADDHLPRGATRLPDPNDPALDPKRPLRISRGFSLILVVLGIVGSLQALAMIGIEAQRYRVAQREVVRLEREVAALKEEEAALVEIAGRSDDTGFRERLARRQGYLFPNEVRFVVAPTPAAAPDAPAPAAPSNP
jgi:type II secretory pathway pseudopilin PulG